MKTIVTFFMIFPMIMIEGCSGSSVTFQSTQDVVIVAQKIGDFTDPGEPIPLNAPIDLKTLTGKMARVTGKVRPPTYWILYRQNFGDLKVRVDTPDAIEASPQKENVTIDKTHENKNPNLVPRLSFLSSQALEKKDFVLAENLADQLAAERTDIALPFVIKGLAKMGLGDKTAAKMFLTKAKSIDPSDAEIVKLLDEVD